MPHRLSAVTSLETALLRCHSPDSLGNWLAETALPLTASDGVLVAGHEPHLRVLFPAELNLACEYDRAVLLQFLRQIQIEFRCTPFHCTVLATDTSPTKRRVTHCLSKPADGMEDKFALIGLIDPGCKYSVWFYRRKATELPYSRPDLELFQRLRPLLLQTLRMLDLAQKNQQQEALVDRLMGWPYPVALVDSKSNISASNPRFASEILQQDRTNRIALIQRLLKSFRHETPTANPGQSGNFFKTYRRFGQRAYQVECMLVRSAATESSPEWLLRFERVSSVDSRVGRLFQNRNLTNRELEIIAAIARGKNNHEIAEALSISYHTVRTHVKNIFKKLGVGSSHEIVLMFSSSNNAFSDFQEPAMSE